METLTAKHYLLEVGIDTEKQLPSGYPYDLPIIRNLPNLELHPQVTFLIGENGIGKSTLIEAIAIAVGLNPEGGSKNFNYSTNNTHTDLFKYLEITKGIAKPKDSFFLRAETYYGLATEIEELGQEVNRYYGDKSLHHQSHGEAFLSLISNRFRGNGLYILDEPEAALSPSSQMKLLVLIDKLVKKNSQFIIATHSPIILSYPGATIFLLEEEKISKINYEDSEHYQLTKYFLNNREKVLKELLKET